MVDFGYAGTLGLFNCSTVQLCPSPPESMPASSPLRALPPVYIMSTVRINTLTRLSWPDLPDPMLSILRDSRTRDVRGGAVCKLDRSDQLTRDAPRILRISVCRLN